MSTRRFGHLFLLNQAYFHCHKTFDIELASGNTNALGVQRLSEYLLNHREWDFFI